MYKRRPRALTLTLPDEKQPFLLLEGRRYTLRNFSEEGIGLWVPAPAPNGLTPGSRISGDIVIGQTIHPVKLEIVHHTSRIIGLRITQKSTELSKIFDVLLEPAVHAAELAPHPDSGTEDLVNGYQRLWFRSPSGNELLVWYQQPQRWIHAIQLCWLGRWVYRQRQRIPETGFLRDEQRVRPGSLIVPEELLMRHTEPDEEILASAAQFLGAVPPPLPGLKFWQFLEMGEAVELPETSVTPSKVA